MAEQTAYSPNPALTPDQHRVLALLAEGLSISAAAEAVGIHRNTIRNWRRAVPAFAREIEFAVREQALVWHDKALDLAPKAAAVLEEILDNPDANPSIRLRAALAILKIAAEPQPKSLRPFSTVAAEMEAEHGQLLTFKSRIVQAVHKEAVHNEKPAQSSTIAPVRKAPEPGRNSLCPCGSGQKYKRCCANHAQSRTNGSPMADSLSREAS